MATSQDYPTSVIARLVREYRVERGLSAERLADQMRELGVPFDKNVIANLETGRRRYVSVAELLALATALGIHPIDLLVPGDAPDDEPYSVTPTLATTAGTAREWISGQGFLSEPADWVALAEAIRSMPSRRAQVMSRLWWTRERQDEQTRAANRQLAAERELAEQQEKEDE